MRVAKEAGARCEWAVALLPGVEASQRTSLFIPSTTMDMDPSLPRSAFPAPHAHERDERNDEDVGADANGGEEVEQPLGKRVEVERVKMDGHLQEGHRETGEQQACVATAEKLLLKRLSSFSRSSMVRCLMLERSSSLSAASMSSFA